MSRIRIRTMSLVAVALVASTFVGTAAAAPQAASHSSNKAILRAIL